MGSSSAHPGKVPPAFSSHGRGQPLPELNPAMLFWSGWESRVLVTSIKEVPKVGRRQARSFG